LSLDRPGGASPSPTRNFSQSRWTGPGGERSIFTSVFLSCNIALVKPFELVGQALSPDGAALKLIRRGDEYLILADGAVLMSSRTHGSEEELATLACQRVRTLKRASVLIGGLGMGFTLRATLDLLSADATVVVAELVPAVVEWNRGPLGPLAGRPLKDKRVWVETGDVGVTLRSCPGQFDAVLLDVDNGPAAFSTSNNARLYDDRGIAAARAALKVEGVVAVWAAQEDRKFEQRLRHGGFDVQVKRVSGRLKKGGPRHTLFLSHKS
jgi:spermidine synthase